MRNHKRFSFKKQFKDMQEKKTPIGLRFAHVERRKATEQST